jgi:D-tyrosyl-tRNA(Tyr) deacylase
MKFVIQRVSRGSIEIRGKKIAEIGTGLLILAGFAQNDQEAQVKKAAEKILKLRIFPSSHKATKGTAQKDIDSSVMDIGGEILVVSQFTLLADLSRGNRPSFIKAAKPELAQKLYNIFIRELKNSGLKVQTGVFREYMKVALVNDGPVTIVY